MAKLRVAVVGGNERAERRKWPAEYDVTCYQGQRYGGDGELRSLKQALQNDRFDAVVLLVRWMGHSMYEVVRSAAKCRVITWKGGLGGLVKNFDKELKAA